MNRDFGRISPNSSPHASAAKPSPRRSDHASNATHRRRCSVDRFIPHQERYGALAVVAYGMTEPLDQLAWLRALDSRGLQDALGIEVTELAPKRVVATMPVDTRTKQPFGLLHGGASVALAETVASLGAFSNIDPAKFAAVGIEINANHLRAKREGVVRATATPVHIGRGTHVWSIEIVDEENRMVCVSRCTLAIVPRPSESSLVAVEPHLLPTPP